MGRLPTKIFVNSPAVLGKPLGLANFAEKSKPDAVVTRGKGSATARKSARNPFHLQMHHKEPSVMHHHPSYIFHQPSTDAPTVPEFRVGQVTRSGLGSLSLQDRQGLSGHSLRLCLSSRYGDVSLAIDIRDGNTSLWQQPGTLRCTSPFPGLGGFQKPSLVQRSYLLVLASRPMYRSAKCNSYGNLATMLLYFAYGGLHGVA